MQTSPQPRKALPKAIRLLRALYEGLEVKTKSGHVISLADDGSIAVKATVYRNGECVGERYLAWDITLREFIQMAEEMSDEELFILTSQLVLKRWLKNVVQDANYIGSMK